MTRPAGISKSCGTPFLVMRAASMAWVMSTSFHFSAIRLDFRRPV
ncbi:hypothetical protein WME97_01635 [Sorangium sp. So ce367]